MKYFDWDDLKNTKLRSERGIGFENILTAIDENLILDDMVDDMEHPNKATYSHQRVLVVAVNSYAYLVPYVEDGEKIFLKTIIPSRKATKEYIKRDSS